jgi:ParB family chromosome partitioning protein
MDGSMIVDTAHLVKMIPIEKIRVLNPRDRNAKKFQLIVQNISNLGLKRPITVSVSEKKNGEQWYDLVCGQGRLEAFVALGQLSIPAVVIDVSREECFLMSLVENLARKQHINLELVQQIGTLKERGYKTSEIAEKIDMNKEYVRGIIRLLDSGEERLINAVEKGRIPITVAMEISAAEDEDAQIALLEAYEKKKLNGTELKRVRQLINQRRSKGKSLRVGFTSSKKKSLTANAMVRTYRQEVDRQNLMIRNAKLCETRLVFIISALSELFEDENFINLLRAELIESMPKYLSVQIKDKNRGSHYEKFN